MKQFKLDKESVSKIIKSELAKSKPELKNIETEFHTFDNNDVPFGRHSALTRVNISADELIGEISSKYEKTIGINEIKEYVIQYFLEAKPELQVDEVVFDDGIDERIVGFLTSERTKKTPYCNGITVTTSERCRDDASTDKNMEELQI